MKKITTKTIFYILLFVVLSLPVKARDLWLEDINVQKLENLYKDIKYTGYPKDHLLLNDRQYPRIFLTKFPKDFEQIIDEEKRNTLFLKIMIPLTLKLNEDITKERNTLLSIKENFEKKTNLTTKEKNFIEKTASKYDSFTRLKDTDRYRYLISDLLTRVDRIPPSIMITASAIETNWGSSRIVREGNSLYKTLEWHTTKGLKPLGETEDATYRIKTYPDLYSAIKDFGLKINSAKSFENFRNFRREFKEMNDNMVGHLLAPHTFGYSNLPNYSGLIDYTLAYYELLEIDKSTLTDKIISSNIVKKYNPYIKKP